MRRRIRAVEKFVADRKATPNANAALCAAEIALNESPEVATHDVAPPDDALSLHDEPPSRPA